MIKNSYGNFFEEWELTTCKKLVHIFRKNSIFLRFDSEDDLLQETLLVCFSVRHKYDPTKGASRETYISTVVRNRLNKIERSRKTKKRRGYYQNVIFDRNTVDRTPVDSGKENLCLGIDLTRAVRQLTFRQKKICVLIRNAVSIQKISSCLRIHRCTVYEEISRIRKVFEREGLKINFFIRKTRHSGS